MATPLFRLDAQVAAPDFVGERRYVILEKELAEREMAGARKRAWLWFRIAALDLYTARDWANYIKLLDSYGRALSKHEHEIREGLVPVHLRATNNSSAGDANVQVHIEVEDGSLRPKKKPPKRPERMDGAPEKGQKHHWRLPAPGGFARRHVKIGNRNLDVTFTRLSAYESERVVRQVIYIDSTAKTRLKYRIRSSQHPEAQHGSIRVPKPIKLS